jgi:hypothetical protein
MPDDTRDQQPEIPLPAGVDEVGQWQPGAVPHRVLFGATRRVDHVTVDSSAHQRSDGRIDTALVHLDAHLDERLSGAQARQVAAALLNAADDIDEWQKLDGA